MGEISFDRIEPVAKKQHSAIEISPDRIDPFDKQSSEIEWKDLYVKSKPYLKPIAEGLAMGVGGLVGSPGGPLGVVAGGTIGYATVDQSFDYLDTVFGVREPGSVGQEIKGGLQNLKEGAEYSVGGELFGAAVGGVVKGGKAAFNKLAPSLTSKKISLKAGQELISQGTDLTADQIEKNVKIGEALQNKIPGLKFTRGQITNDAQAIALERSLIRSGTKFQRGRIDVSGADLNQEQRAFAEKALQDYYESNLSKGSIQDVTDIISKEKAGIEKTIEKSQDVVDSEVARLSRVMDEQEISPKILSELKTGKQSMRNEAKELYDNIPNESLPTNSLKDGIEKFVSNEDGIIEPKTKKMLDLIISKTTKKTKSGVESIDTGYQVLRKLRSRVGKNYRAASSGVNPDLEDARQLNEVMKIIDDTMSQMKYANPEAKVAYEKATRFYADEYIPKFRQGTVADVLQKGNRGEETKIALSNISSKFFTKDGIDDFYKAVGDNDIATDAIKDYARFDLFNKAYNPSKGALDNTKVAGWINKNKVVLNKIGIKKEFDEILKKGLDLDVNQIKLEKFNKSMAARVLNANPSDAIPQAFKGSKNYAVTAKELMELAKGDKAAQEGIKSAISDHILNSSKVTAEGFFTDYKVSVAKLTNKLKEYMPALREVYKNEPKKLQAILDVKKSYNILARSSSSPIGGGSDTAENFSHILAAATGARAGHYYLIISIKKALSKYADNQINKYLLRATFDPDYATNLMAIARANTYKRTNTGNIRKQFDFLMRKLVPYAVKKDIEGTDR